VHLPSSLLADKEKERKNVAKGKEKKNTEKNSFQKLCSEKFISKCFSYVSMILFRKSLF